jgi:hypothetical protein
MGGACGYFQFMLLKYNVDLLGNTSQHHNPDDGDRDSSRNVVFYLQPIDAAVCPRKSY